MPSRGEPPEHGFFEWLVFLTAIGVMLSIDLLARITSWLDDACPGRHPVHQSTCLRPQGHDGDCTDAYDRTWTAPVVPAPRREREDE